LSHVGSLFFRGEPYPIFTFCCLVRPNFLRLVPALFCDLNALLKWISSRSLSTCPVAPPQGSNQLQTRPPSFYPPQSTAFYTPESRITSSPSPLPVEPKPPPPLILRINESYEFCTDTVFPCTPCFSVILIWNPIPFMHQIYCARPVPEIPLVYTSIDPLSGLQTIGIKVAVGLSLNQVPSPIFPPTPPTLLLIAGSLLQSPIIGMIFPSFKGVEGLGFVNHQFQQDRPGPARCRGVER